MNFFISEGVIKRLGKDGFLAVNDEFKLRGLLSIPEKMPNGKEKMVDFIFEVNNLKKDDLKKDCLIENVTLTIEDENTFKIRSMMPDEITDVREKYMYVLVRARDCAPDDMYVRNKKAKCVKVIRHIHIANGKTDYGVLDGNIYLARVEISNSQLLTLYMGGSKERELYDFFNIYRRGNKTKSYNVSKAKKLRIPELVDSGYISFSEL